MFVICVGIFFISGAKSISRNQDRSVDSSGAGVSFSILLKEIFEKSKMISF
jgi:hypothetical protein